MSKNCHIFTVVFLIFLLSQINYSLATNTTVMRLYFSGSGISIDQNLTAFYAFFAKRYPKSLLPRKVNPNANFISSDVMSSKLLYKNYRETFTSDVHAELSNFVGFSALPNLKHEIINYTFVLPENAIKDDINKVAKSFRLTDDKSKFKKFQNFYFIESQGLSISLIIPKDQSQSIRQDLRNFIHNYDRTTSKNIAIYLEEDSKLNPDSIENSNYIIPNGLNIEPNEIEIIANVNNQRMNFEPYNISEKGYDRPDVFATLLIIDSFPVEGKNPIYKLKHSDINSTSIQNNPIKFIQSNNSGHGIHVAGIINAKPNGFGIVGISPYSKIQCYNAKYIDDILNANSTCFDYEIPIVLVCLDLPNQTDRGENSYYEKMKKAFENELTNRSFIVSAGNYDDASEKRGKLTKNYCNILPSCFGFLPNVISVAALDKTQTLLPTSCFGNEIVSIAAPGKSVLSTDIDNAYSVREGTSVSAPYVAGTAAILKEKHPSLMPFEIKQRIIATSTFDTIEDEKDKIIGGILNVNEAINNVFDDVVVFSNGERITGNIKNLCPKKDFYFPSFLMYNRETYFQDDKASYTIPTKKLLRIHRNGTKFTVVYKSNFKHYVDVDLNVVRNKIIKPNGAGMACLYNAPSNCFSITGINDKEIPFQNRNIDLFEIDDIYFGFKK